MGCRLNDSTTAGWIGMIVVVCTKPQRFGIGFVSHCGELQQYDTNPQTNQSSSQSTSVIGWSCLCRFDELDTFASGVPKTWPEHVLYVKLDLCSFIGVFMPTSLFFHVSTSMHDLRAPLARANQLLEVLSKERPILYNGPGAVQHPKIQFVFFSCDLCALRSPAGNSLH